jgi:LacI family transcriptional regulator
VPSEVSPGDTRRGAARVTIRQVAELAGVSIATVSRVLNGRADVSEETRLVVERVARAQGYGTRRAATGRARADHDGQREGGRGEGVRGAGGRGEGGRQGAGLVGVTMPYPGSAYFAAILAGAAEALYERNTRVLLCPTRHEHDREVSLLDRLIDEQTDGALLVLPEESDAELRRLSEHGFCFVVVDPLHDVGDGIPVVSAANASGANQATAHLLGLGHRRIGVITGPAGGVATKGRLQGYHAALAAAGIMPDPALEVAGDFMVASGAAGANHLLDQTDPPTAIFAFNDGMAVGALQAGRGRGLRLPEELSVVGFDDTLEAELAYPPLTTVRQPLAELGRMAVSLLFRLLRQQWFEPMRVELATRLVVRSSTSPPRG